MNILMIGDSWGVPNYSTAWPDCSYTDHTEYQLQNLGHKVFNCSMNGCGMIETIAYARSLVDLSYDNPSMKATIEFKRDTFDHSPNGIKKVPVPNYKGEHIDWVVWFHTEPMRSLFQEDAHDWITLEELHNIGCHIGYRAFINLLKFLPGVKTAIIGGQSIVDPILYQYHKPTFIIEDWRSEIIGRKLPRCVSLARLNLVEKFYDDTEAKIKILDAHREVLGAMQVKELFFDGCHPGAKPHHELAERLHNEFMKGKK